MPRTPTKAVIAGEERGLLERQQVFRFAADRVTAALAQCGDVEAIALIGSVARPLRREVPRFAPYKQLRLPIAHECKDVDLAAWVSRVDGVDELRRARGRAIKEIVAERGHGPAVHEIDVFLLEPSTNRYLGRLCYFRQCPAGKRDCLPPDAVNIHSSSNTTNFRSGRKRSPKATPFGSMTALVAGSSRKLWIYHWSSLMLICEKLVAMIGAR